MDMSDGDYHNLRHAATHVYYYLRPYKTVDIVSSDGKFESTYTLINYHIVKIILSVTRYRQPAVNMFKINNNCIQ